MQNKILVVAAIILDNEKILCVQRGKNKYDYISEKYEFPGGKVERGESREDALIREIYEELSMKIRVKENFLVVDHVYPDFSIQMHSFICTSDNKTFLLSEHIDSQWLGINHLANLDWAAADLPIVQKLIGLCK